jgi:peptide/nickel transport system substrate-binding protein
MMKNLRWQLLVVVVALVVIAVLLISQKPAIIPQQNENVEIQPIAGGVYTEGLVGAFNRLNPLLDSGNQADRDVNRLIFSSLVKFDDQGLPHGDLADSWGVSQDGTIYNFLIRENAAWHDGTPVTSEDVAYSVGLLKSDEAPLSDDLKDFWQKVEVVVLDEKTLQFRLPEPFAPFLDFLTFGILPKHILGETTFTELIDAPFNLSPIGSGPYRFADLLVEEGAIQGVTLAANPDYHLGKPYIEQIVFRYYPDAPSALAAYQRDEVMGINQVTPDILADALAVEGLNQYSSRLPELAMLYLNLADNARPFFQEPEVRKALLTGINRQAIVDRQLGGQAVTAHGPILAGTWAYYQDTPEIPYDPEAAIDMLKEAGYTLPPTGGTVREKEGTRLEFELVHPDQAPYPEIAAQIQQNWAELGVQANLKAVPFADLISDYLDRRSYQAALVDLNLTNQPDPDPYPFWHQTQKVNGQNYAGWDDRQASEYLEQARVTVDIAERLRLYRNFQVRFANMLPALPLFHPVYSYAVDNQVQGVQMGPLFDPSDRLAQVASWFLLARQGTAEVQETVSPTP